MRHLGAFPLDEIKSLWLRIPELQPVLPSPASVWDAVVSLAESCSHTILRPPVPIEWRTSGCG